MRAGSFGLPPSDAEAIDQLIFYPTSRDHLVQGGLHPTAIQGCGGSCSPLQATMTIREKQHRIAMHLPEAAQHSQRYLRQWDEAVLVALLIADMHALAGRVDIAYLQAQTFTEAQAQTVSGEVEDPVAQRVRGLEHAPGLFNGEDVGQALRLRRLDQVQVHPGLLQHMGVEELQPPTGRA